jgi:hypothetical protein
MSVGTFRRLVAIFLVLLPLVAVSSAGWATPVPREQTRFVCDVDSPVIDPDGDPDYPTTSPNGCAKKLGGGADSYEPVAGGGAQESIWARWLTGLLQRVGFVH